MSEPPTSFVPYQVSYTELVRNELRALAARAKARGLGREVYEALDAIDRQLRTYPQFGEPLRDLKIGAAQLCIATVPPLVVRYVLNEDRRLVIVAIPIQPLPNSGLDP